MPTDVDRSPAIVAGVVVASETPDTLPGLDDGWNPETASYLEKAVVSTLDHYREAGLITPAMSGKVALALSLTRVMVGKERRGRTSTYANDARLLNEILDGFVAEEGAGNDALRQAMAQWSSYLQGLAAGQAIAEAS